MLLKKKKCTQQPHMFLVQVFSKGMMCSDATRLRFFFLSCENSFIGIHLNVYIFNKLDDNSFSFKMTGINI